VYVCECVYLYVHKCVCMCVLTLARSKKCLTWYVRLCLQDGFQRLQAGILIHL
jgi:hypothetical protein